MRRLNYAPACKEAEQYAEVLFDDPMSTHAPVGEILEGWMAKHIRKCEKCKQATFEASMP